MKAAWYEKQGPFGLMITVDRAVDLADTGVRNESYKKEAL
jgi:hypothetical protein